MDVYRPKQARSCDKLEFEELTIDNLQLTIKESLRDKFKRKLGKIFKFLRFYFKIVPQGHNNCQFSIVNCQFRKHQFIVL